MQVQESAACTPLEADRRQIKALHLLGMLWQCMPAKASGCGMHASAS
jgi:hypothetical protein